MSKILFFMCVIGCFMPATLMAKVEKVFSLAYKGNFISII